MFERAKPKFISRKQNSLNERFPQLKDAGKVIQGTTAVLDGEIVALDEKGLPHFDGLRSRRTKSAVVFYAFDFLYLDGYDLSRCPLIKRKELLRKILPKDNTGRVRYTDHITGRANAYSKRLKH